MASDPTAYLLAKKNAQKNAKLDLDDLLGTPKRPNASPVVSGYGFLTTPQITPGEDGDEPPMTWGDINATPLLLDPTDTPIDAANADGPQFRVPEMSKREKIAIELAEKNSREKKTKQLLQAQANAAATAALNAHVSTPMRMGTGGRTPLSKAAQIVAGKVFAARSAGKGGNSTGRLDSQLRASYGSSTPSTPFRTPGSTPSHRGGMTPSVSVVPQSPASNTKPANPSASLTDNLLNI
jgi:protein DGCR14